MGSRSNPADTAMAPEATAINAAPTAQQQPHFVEMVSSIPVVASALDVAKHYYDATKSRYELVGRIEKELVENVVPQVVTTATKATPQTAQVLITTGLTQLDQYACTTLDIIEKNVPIIMEPAPKIIETGKNLVNDKIITPVDQLVEKALGYSEDKVNQLLPNTTATPAEPAANEGEGSPAKKQKIARAQKLGVEVSKRLSERATTHYESLKKVTPQDLQKLVSSDAVRLVSSNVEKQLAWLKENVDQVLARLQKEKEDGQLRKHFETYSTELRTSFAHAIEKLEKVTPATVKETTHTVFQGLSKSISDFAENFKHLTSAISVNPAVTNDPYVKLFLDSANSTIAYFQTYAQSLAHLNIFQKPAPAVTSTSSTSTESQ